MDSRLVLKETRRNELDNLAVEGVHAMRFWLFPESPIPGNPGFALCGIALEQPSSDAAFNCERLSLLCLTM